MELLTRHFGSSILVTLQGHLTVARVADWRAAIDVALAEGGVTVVVDCRQVDYLDTAGLAALVRLAQDLDTRGGQLRIAGLHEELRGFLELARALPVVQLFPDSDAALADL